MKKHVAVFSLLMAAFLSSSAFAKCRPEKFGSPGGDSSGGIPLHFRPIKLLPAEFMPTGVIDITHVSVGEAQAFQNFQGPDTLLYTCDLADEGKTFENFATNGDDATGGYLGNSDGVYQTYFPFIGIKLIRDKDGLVFSRYWQQAPVSGHKEGNKLKFYARDFSSVTAELHRLPETMRGSGDADWSGCHGAADDNSTNIAYKCTQPNGYTVFVGPGWNDDRDIKPGTDSRSHWGGFSASNWIGFGMYYASGNHFAQSPWGCRVLNYTNPVILPPVKVSELMSGGEPGANFNVTYRCGGPLIRSIIRSDSGVGPGKISVGFITDHPVTPGHTWSRLTLSDNYGQDGYASNVGIGVSVNGQDMGFLTSADADYHSKGWFGLLNGGQFSPSQSASQIDVTSQYFAHYGVIDGQKKVTPGKVDATAYIVVRFW